MLRHRVFFCAAVFAAIAMTSSLFPLAASAASITITPNPVTDCVAGFGRALISWQGDGPGLVRVRIGVVSFTWWGPPTDSLGTGYWITKGMTFSLVDETGTTVAEVSAQLNCGGAAGPGVIDSVSSPDAYLPLQLGNRWIYRVNSRIQTSSYVSWTVTKVRTVANRNYHVVEINSGAGVSEMLLRSEASGRIYRLSGETEQLWLDPTASPDPSAQLKIDRRGSATLPGFGSFPDALYYSFFGSETGIFVKGVGLASSTTNILAGSSGGFSHSLELVEARVGRLHLSTTVPTVRLSAESLRLDVSGKNVTNCAVPCYFVACGLVSTTDPAGTWKPCFQARVGITHPQASFVDLALLDPSGASLYKANLTVAPAPDGEFLFFQQIPLYSAPNVPFPPGAYRVSVIARDAAGSPVGAEASLLLRVE